mmetsp:Transcript_56557/g.132667  ORF Transcript_56557/g.132667 Transcript_56557/m.132667 type:complete len:580 (-) Transcript_56557:32-1771(-)
MPRGGISTIYFFRTVFLLCISMTHSHSPVSGEVTGSAQASWVPVMPWEVTGPQALPALLAELSLDGDVLPYSAEDIDARLSRLEDSLRSTFKSVQKNEHGNLGIGGVRYVLHRFFVQQHGWSVKGLHSEGSSWNSSSPLEFMDGHVSNVFKDALQQHLEKSGFSLREIAVAAALLESLVHEEFQAKVGDAYALHKFSTVEPLPLDQVDEAVDTYMAIRIMQTVSPQSIKRLSPGILRKYIPMAYPTWKETQSFMRAKRESASGWQTTMPFDVVLSFLAEAVDEWGRWQNNECLDLKHKLMDVEDQHSGCVRLADFYRARTEHNVWQFSESPSYLREHGILDSSDDPHVIIPNYVNGQGNCIPASHFYSTCCLNECEELLANLEHHFEAPQATPQQVASVLESMSGPLSPLLMARLEQVGDSSGGRVPFHGRMFMQWLHHAFPRECPYPHLSGTTLQQNLWDYEAVAGRGSSRVSKEEALQIISSLGVQTEPVHDAGTQGTCAPWVEEEEFYVQPLPFSMAVLEHDATLWTASYSITAVCAFSMIIVTLMRTLGLALRRPGTGKATAKMGAASDRTLMQV